MQLFILEHIAEHALIEGIVHLLHMVTDAGSVFVLDRLKDITIRGGKNIDCTEVKT